MTIRKSTDAQTLTTRYRKRFQFVQAMWVLELPSQAACLAGGQGADRVGPE